MNVVDRMMAKKVLEVHAKAKKMCLKMMNTKPSNISFPEGELDGDCRVLKKKRTYTSGFSKSILYISFNLISRVKVLCNNVQECFAVWGDLYGSVW